MGAPVILERPPGTVQVMDAFTAQSDELWQRAVDRQRWTRTDSAPVQLFATSDKGEHLGSPDGCSIGQAAHSASADRGTGGRLSG